MRGVFEWKGSWWIRFADGQGKYRRGRVGSYKAAEKLYHKRKQQALEGVKLPETLRRRAVRFQEIADDALIYSKANKRDYRNDLSRIARLMERFGASPADALTGPEMEAHLSVVAAKEEWKPSTYNHYRALIGLCFREARRIKKASTNPARDIHHPEPWTGRGVHSPA
jgi:hypothetical protein